MARIIGEHPACTTDLRTYRADQAQGNPTTLEQLAEVVDRPVVETAVLVRGATTARIEKNLIYWDEPFPGARSRRMLYVGDRAIPRKFGCAPDLFAFAAVLDVPFRVEDTDAGTGDPIRIDFVPNGYQHVDPPETVTVLQSLTRLRDADSGVFEQVDTNVCANQPFFASAKEAEPALAASPGTRPEHLDAVRCERAQPLCGFGTRQAHEERPSRTG